MTHAEARAVVEKVAEELGTRLTLGYIGNTYIGPPWDDRLWMTWFEDIPRGTGEQHPNNKPSLVLGRTEDVLAMSEFKLRTQLKRRFAYLSELACNRKVS